MSSQWKMVPVEPTETMVINGFESVPDECFTDEQVWEQYQGMSGCQQAAFRAKLCWAAMLASAPAAPQAELDPAVAERDANPKPDPVLCKFYDVDDWASLVRELVDHVAQLQDSAKRNVKPWEDTFPPTLLPAYIERVNAANAAAQPQGEPVEWGAPKTVRQLIRQLETLDQDLRPLSMLRVPASIFEDGKERVRATHLSFSHERVDGQWLAPFKSDGEKVLAFWCRMEQPAPITVVQPFAEKVIRKLERFQECADDGQGADIGRHWFDLLTQLGLLNRVQRSPALWEMTQQGEDALELSRQSAKSR